MILNYFFGFLLFLPACLAQLYTNFTEKDFCPYAEGIFMSIVTVGGTKEYIKINKFATAACYKEIEEDYESALKEFVSNMTELSCKVGMKYLKNDNYLQNYAYFAAKAIEDIGVRMKQYYILMRNAFRTASFDKVDLYESAIVKNVNPKHEHYIRNFDRFQKMHPGKDKELRHTVHEYCKNGVKKLISVAVYFKLCMTRRINETEEYFNCLKKNGTKIKLTDL